MPQVCAGCLFNKQVVWRYQYHQWWFLEHLLYDWEWTDPVDYKTWDWRVLEWKLSTENWMVEEAVAKSMAWLEQRKRYYCYEESNYGDASLEPGPGNLSASSEQNSSRRRHRPKPY